MKKVLLAVIMVLFMVGTALSADIALKFAWNHEDPPDVAEWVLYSSETQGGPYVEMGPIPNTPPNYVFVADWTFQVTANTDKTYYFVATAKDADGNESEYSNEVSKEIDVQAPGAPITLTVTIEIVP